jgi:peptide/nickel transport system substrate-binding protein
MKFFSKLRRRLGDFFAQVALKRQLERLNRADIVLAHRVIGRRRFPSLGQWRQIGKVLSAKEKKYLFFSFLAIFSGLIFAGGAWAFEHAVFVPTRGGEYREGVVGGPETINPVLVGRNDVDNAIIRLVYRGLYGRDKNGELVLDLAEKVDISADGKKYTFTLIPNISFHDGSRLLASDVVFTINAIKNPKWQSPLKDSLSGVAAAAPDERTVVIDLNEPSAFLPAALTFGIIAEHIWKNIEPSSPSLSDYNLKPVGCGPFRFEQFSRDRENNIVSYQLKAAAADTGLERIIFKFYGDYDTALNALAANAVDGLSYVPPSYEEAVAAIPGIVLRAPALTQYTAIFLNAKKNPALSDKNIRAALSLAVDREKIKNELLGEREILRTSPFINPALDAAAEKTSFDRAAANMLLDKTDFRWPENGRYRIKTEVTKAKTKTTPEETKQTELAITIATVTTPDGTRLAEMIRDDWEAIGVRAEIIAAASQDIQKSIIRPREYEALIFGEILPTDADPYPFWHSSQAGNGLNLSNFSDRRADELLEKARLSPNVAERDKYLADFSKLITQENAAIFLYQPSYLYPQSSKIKDFSTTKITTPADRFNGAIDWFRRYRLSFR